MNLELYLENQTMKRNQLNKQIDVCFTEIASVEAISIKNIDDLKFLSMKYAEVVKLIETRDSLSEQLEVLNEVYIFI